ncbi:unnamed protein product [Phytophthora lilii]|uniref:Unnamed protein product n=1 Tax=Phytophthora lilii TaxID=2077276 RepID=A0A9W6UBY7_9STRA|nr:unnamed protein product [Phytophthora lilii]
MIPRAISRFSNSLAGYRLPTSVTTTVVSMKNRVASAVMPVCQGIESSALYQRTKRSSLWSQPWLGWAFVYSFSLFILFIYRWKSLRALLEMYATPKDGTIGVIVSVLFLGFLEDFVCVTYFACALWSFDALRRLISKSTPLRNTWKWGTFLRHCSLSLYLTGNIANFTVSWLLFVAMMAPVVADLLIVQIRGMRFTFDRISMAIEEKDHVSAAPISSEEITEGYISAAALIIIAKIFAFVRTKGSWTDLTLWNPTLHLAHMIILRTDKALSRSSAKPIKSGAKVTDRSVAKNSEYVEIELSNDGADNSEIGTAEYAYSNEDSEALLSHSKTFPSSQKPGYKWLGVQVAIVLFGLLIMPAIVVALSCSCSPLVAYSALNASLNELLSHALEPSMNDEMDSIGDAWVETYIHNSTEKHSLFGRDTLYRTTTGFQGDLEFDVKVSADNPPNVLIIAVESFQFHDSRYLVGDEDPSNLFKGTNLTITPNFDRWAKRGVALRNFWSSVRTSRSVESILYAQIPYDSPVHTGMAGGRKDTRLAGLPQLFAAKGYETFFTTGCTTHYDSWDIFLPIHGFQTVWSEIEMKKLAQNELNITRDDWRGPEGRGLHWGVHDDISFKILGDLMSNKTKEQRQKMAAGKSKEPLFLTHYTISSHGPYQERPRWFAEAEKPDFSDLYTVASDPKLRQDYLEMRYFSDMELGKFLDRMEAEGILNDTIVVITGDHGTGDDVSAMRVAGAIIAEGRLGDTAGLVLDDAAEHYDLLNTLADITGVPEGGFLQDGVGRSLKRKVPFGERVVFSNDPNHNMAIVRGHQRFRYHRISDAVLLHDIDTDHHMNKDLFPELSEAEQEEWLTWRDHGRRLNSYYTHRWDNKCLLTVKC